MIIDLAWWVIIGRWRFIRYVKSKPSMGESEFYALQRNIPMINKSLFISYDMICILERFGSLVVKDG